MYYIKILIKRLTSLSLFPILSFISLILIGSTAALGAGPLPVDLQSAENFTILAETGITNTGSHTSVITGNIGNSPGTAAQMDDVWCSEITGTIYGVDAAYTGSGTTTCYAGNPPLSNKTLVDNAVNDMLTAYNNAAAVVAPAPIVDLGGGNIGGMTLAPALYKWNTGVNIATDLTLSGGASDVWIFQISGDLDIASGGSVPAGTKVLLSGGARASNVFWQVGGATGATLGTYSTFNGIILSAKQIILQTGAVLNGKALAQTQVTLDANVVNDVAGCPLITLTPAPPIPQGTVSVAYSQMITASGGTAPYTYSVTAGALPAGLSLNATTGLISGTPTATGTSTFTVTAIDDNGCPGEETYTIVINDAGSCPVITLTPPPIPQGTVSVAYSQTITASGGTAPYTYSITAGTLPAGLSLNAATGLISGTPTTAGTSNFTVTAIDDVDCPGEESYSIVINGSGGPGAEAISVPMLSQWGMIIFIVLMGLGTMYYLRRKRI